MAQNYECVLLMDPALSDSQVEAYLEQFSGIVTNAEGEVVHVQKWGRRRMEYPIQGQRDAFYGILYFRMTTPTAGVVQEFERQVRINDELLREMTVKVPELKILDIPKPRVAEPAEAPAPAETASETPAPAETASETPAPAETASETPAPAETAAEEPAQPASGETTPETKE